MANPLFKISMGLNKDLPSGKVPGQVYVTTDKKKMHIDVDGDTRIELNAAEADVATKLGTSNIGSTTKPIYLSGGTPYACGSSLATNITGNASTATKVYTTSTNPSTGTTYAIPFMASTSSGNQSLLTNNGIGFWTVEGTTSAVGTGELKLGNSTASGTAGNKRGMIYMYGTSSGYTEILPTNNTTSNIQINLPSKAGNIALTSDNVASATKLQTARTIQTNLASTSAASFDGSANITPGVTGTLRVANGGTGVSSHTTNRLVWSTSATQIQAAYHYANGTKIGINYTSEPSTNFYVNGTSAFRGNITIPTDDTDRFISFENGTGFGWRIGYLGTGAGDANYLAIQSDGPSAGTYSNALRFGLTTLDAAFGGNVYPLVNNTKTLGTSSYKWNNVYATTFTGNLSGNASTATSATQLSSNSRMDYGWNGVNYFNLSGTAGNAAKTNDTPTSAWWHILRFNHANSDGYYTDLAIPFNANSLYYKRIVGGSVQNGGWVKVLDALNYTNYTVTKTGSGASGTWGINITENAATATRLKITNSPGYTTGLYYYQGQPSIGTAAGNCYEGSSNNINLWSYPADGTYSNGTETNIQTLRLMWGSTYWSELFFSPNQDDIYHRCIMHGIAYGWKKIWESGDSVTGAVWNDYAECRKSDCEDFGYVLMEVGDDSLTKTTERLSHFAGISSDTWGFSQGETDKAKTPIAVAGRVLVYPYQDRNNYKPGDCVCAAPGGTVDIMTREEVINWPDRIVGTVSCVPDYEEWGGGEMADRPAVRVDGRIWIKVR